MYFFIICIQCKMRTAGNGIFKKKRIQLSSTGHFHVSQARGTFLAQTDINATHSLGPRSEHELNLI